MHELILRIYNMYMKTLLTKKLINIVYFASGQVSIVILTGTIWWHLALIVDNRHGNDESKEFTTMV